MKKGFLLVLCIFVWVALIHGSLMALAPYSWLDELYQDIYERQMVMHLIQAGMYNAEELAFIDELENLYQDWQLGNVSDAALENRVLGFMQKFNKVCENNLSLYGIVEKFYLRFPAGQESLLKIMVYDLLTSLGTSLRMADNRVSRDYREEQTVARQTSNFRLELTDKAIEPFLKQAQGRFVFYDMACSYGVETWRSFDKFKRMRHSNRVDPFFVAVDLNMVQYTLYDAKRKVKVYVNSLGQPVYFVENGKMSEAIFSWVFSRGRGYKQAFEELSRDPLSGRFKEQGDFVLETNVVLDPRFKAAKASGQTNYFEHDLFKSMPEGLEHPHVIRIMNLLIYFDKDKKTILINNLLKFLRRGGLLVLNLDHVIEDAEFIFVLKKDSNKKVTIYKIPTPNYTRRSRFQRFISGIFNMELKEIETILGDLGIAWEERDEKPEADKFVFEIAA